MVSQCCPNYVVSQCRLLPRSPTFSGYITTVISSKFVHNFYNSPSHRLTLCSEVRSCCRNGISCRGSLFLRRSLRTTINHVDCFAMAHLTRSSDAVESTNLLQTSSSGTRGKQRAASPSFTYESVNIRLLAGSTVLDDAVSIGVKRLGTTLIVSVSLWLLSYVVVMMQVIEKGHFVPFTSFLFIPMWTGSVYGFASVTVILIGVCKNGGTLISKERKLFMQAQGVELEQYIDFESLPLMRRLFFWSSVLATFLMLSFTTQIFLYLWLVAGVIGMWHAFYPVLLVFILLLTYLMLVRTLSPSTCWCFALSFVGLVC